MQIAIDTISRKPRTRTTVVDDSKAIVEKNDIYNIMCEHRIYFDPILCVLSRLRRFGSQTARSAEENRRRRRSRIWQLSMAGNNDDSNMINH